MEKIQKKGNFDFLFLHALIINIGTINFLLLRLNPPSIFRFLHPWYVFQLLLPPGTHSLPAESINNRYWIPICVYVRGESWNMLAQKGNLQLLLAKRKTLHHDRQICQWVDHSHGPFVVRKIAAFHIIFDMLNSVLCGRPEFIKFMYL